MTSGPQSQFWRRHVRLGVASTALSSTLGFAYIMATWSAPNRPLMLGIASLALVTCPLILSGPGMRAFTGPARRTWLYAWSISLLVAVTGATMLDGGATSPLAMLFAASLVFTASGFGRSGAAVMGASTIACYLVTVAHGSPGTWHAVQMVAALAVVAATCTLTAGGLLNSLQEQQRLTDALTVRAAHDGLTGCLNRTTLLEHLELEVTRSHREDRPLGLVMMDLDDFKAVNDNHGHVTGDDLLAALGAELKSSVRPYDLVGRVGGDEFAIVSPNTSEPELRDLAERVRLRMAAVGEPFGVDVSVGLAVLDLAEDSRMLRQRADEALYLAKRAVPQESP